MGWAARTGSAVRADSAVQMGSAVRIAKPVGDSLGLASDCSLVAYRTEFLPFHDSFTSCLPGTICAHVALPRCENMPLVFGISSVFSSHPSFHQAVHRAFSGPFAARPPRNNFVPRCNLGALLLLASRRIQIGLRCCEAALVPAKPLDS